MSPLQAADAARKVPQSLRPDQYRAHVNPQWVRLLDLLGMNVQYASAQGAWLHTADGRAILDFLSGYCVHNTGHNHPRIVAALQDELSQNGAAMAQSHASDRAGELARRLCEQAGSNLKKVSFCSSGREGVETVIKFARAFTGRTGLLYAEGAFHGLTCGALSMMGDSFWRGDFGPLLPDTQAIPFGDVAALESNLSTHKFMAFLLEPIQSEAGIRIPDAAYLETAQALCGKYGTLFVLDEVQTGLGRTGKFLAGHRYNVEPDMGVLAKALSGGLIPSAAVLMTDEIYRSVFDSLKHSIIHTSTYSENGLAMRAGIATLDLIEEESLVDRSEHLGLYLRQRLYQQLSR